LQQVTFNPFAISAMLSVSSVKQLAGADAKPHNVIKITS